MSNVEMEEIVNQQAQEAGVPEECPVPEEEQALTQEELDEVFGMPDEKVGPKDRLKNEIADLRDKINKLHSFLNRRNEDGVLMVRALNFTEAQIYLLHEQIGAMENYYNILVSRLSIFDVTVGDEVGDVKISG